MCGGDRRQKFICVEILVTDINDYKLMTSYRQTGFILIGIMFDAAINK